MKLAIADPPYLGYAVMFYGGGAGLQESKSPPGIVPPKTADFHPQAKEWDDPARHERLVGDLEAEFDGWAIAMSSTNINDYARWLPDSARWAIWHDPMKMPNGAHPRRRFEAVAVKPPQGRRRVLNVALPVGDVLTTPHNSAASFAGAKPAAWTEWVLSMLGYCDAHDSVVDLFAGSGAVANVLAQGRLTECRCITSQAA